MKKSLYFLCTVVFFIVFAGLGYAADKSYRIETLQVTDNPLFQKSTDGFIKELEKNGLVKGKNLTVKRTVIDFDIENAGIWSKASLLMKIKSAASRIADTKPDLVLTIGTPATKYGKDRIISAGIPMVFNSVAFPEAAGCKSLTEAGPGFTGTTSYMNVKDALKIVKLAFPSIKTYGVVYSDYEAAVTHADEMKKYAPGLGMNIVYKQVKMSDPVKPAMNELIAKGAQAVILPLDVYFGLKNMEPYHELDEILRQKKMPAISFINMKSPGGCLYVGSDYAYLGALSGQQAAKILKEGAKPESLPVMRQQDLTILTDLERIKSLGIQVPVEVFQLAKPIQ